MTSTLCIIEKGEKALIIVAGLLLKLIYFNIVPGIQNAATSAQYLAG